MPIPPPNREYPRDRFNFDLEKEKKHRESFPNEIGELRHCILGGKRGDDDRHTIVGIERGVRRTWGTPIVVVEI